MTLVQHRSIAALLFIAVLLSACQHSKPVASERLPQPPPPPPMKSEIATAAGEHPSTELHLRANTELPRLPAMRISPRIRWNEPDPLNPPGLKTPTWAEPTFIADPPELLLQDSPPHPRFALPTDSVLPLRVRHLEMPSLPQPDLTLALSKPLTPESLQFQPEGAKLRPRSPYCMPGHTSQNFVLYSVHDGLPLHPGVW